MNEKGDWVKKIPKELDKKYWLKFKEVDWYGIK